jgi:hypothetical protein
MRWRRRTPSSRNWWRTKRWTFRSSRRLRQAFSLRSNQQPFPGRVPQPKSLRLSAGGESARQATPATAQPRAPTLVIELPDAGGISRSAAWRLSPLRSGSRQAAPFPPTKSRPTQTPKTKQNSHSKWIKNRGQATLQVTPKSTFISL